MASLQLEKLVSDVESGFLGFTVTGRTSSLESYDSARRALPVRLRRLQSVVADDSDQRARARVLVTADPGVRNDFVAAADPAVA